MDKYTELSSHLWFLFNQHFLGANETFNKTELYGMNMWDVLSDDLPSPRDEIIHNYDKASGAIRQGDYKVIVSLYITTLRQGRTHLFRTSVFGMLCHLQ